MPEINDCFSPFQELMPTEEAIARLRKDAKCRVGTETLPLMQAAGRILAQDLASSKDVPGFTNAAVDGFAFAHADYLSAADHRLDISGYIPAGSAKEEKLQSNTAARIFTGAKIPDGADTVVMQEDVNLEGDSVFIPAGIAAGINCRPRGEDVKQGELLLSAGHKLRPQDIGMVAAFGFAEVSVFQPLKVAIFSTGNEIREPGAALAEDSVYDVNRYMLNALLTNMGCLVSDLGILKDDRAIIERVLINAAQHHQVLITSGGASTGDADHIARIMEDSGKISFWRLAIKPGRPLAIGLLDDRKFIGFPGNPVAVAVCFFRFAYPLLAVLAGQKWPEPQYFQIPAAFSMNKKAGRREWVRAQLIEKDGEQFVVKHPKQGSGMLTSLVESEGLVELPEEVTRVKEGDRLAFMPFSQFGV